MNKADAMDLDKRERVMDAALGEFCKGFKAANTDALARSAGISKGLLFHYFGTKNGLLGYVFEYALERVTQDFFTKLPLDEPDFLKRVRGMMEVKMALSLRHPSLFDFIGTVYLNEEPEFAPLRERLLLVREVAWSSEGELMQNIDRRYFKPGLDVEKAMEVVHFTLLGYGDQIVRRYPKVADYQTQFEEITQVTDGYFEFFKALFYRED